MDKDSAARLYDRYERMSYALEREAYRQQIAGRTKPLRQFHPCQKAIVFTAAMATPGGMVSSLVIPKAALTHCDCHPGMGEIELWQLYDDCKERTK